MTAKRSLENRLRGWMPKESFSICTPANISAEPSQQPVVIPSGVTLNAITVAGVSAVVYIALATVFIGKFGPTQIHIMPEIAWIIVGVAVGILSNYMFTQSQLCRLSRSYRIEGPNKKELLLLIAPLLTIWASSFLFNSSFFNATQALNLSLLSAYMALVPHMPIRFWMFHSYEKKENMRLMQDWIQIGTIAIPKPPNPEVKA
ncbi:MAG: hypothetical protein NWF01_10800 [Candidatus Bathyarchaeota archaeon]|nr:hypothetical protein [Candidatus Bathyarchaeota archaeon]